MIEAVIVDDEKAGIESLGGLLNKYCKDVRIVGTANNIEEARKVITTVSPDLVFLDIYMPSGNGFELLQNIPIINFEIVFTTAFDEYAIRAIRAGAIDYLLKPVDPEELVAAVEKVKDKLSRRQGDGHLTDRIMVRTEKSFQIVPVSEIICIETDRKKVMLRLKNKLLSIKENNISSIEDMLLKHNFFRLHRSYIVNLKEIKEYVPGRTGGYTITTDGKVIPVASRRKEAFLNVFLGK
jgi:two-component system LytT family response regulator